MKTLNSKTKERALRMVASLEGGWDKSVGNFDGAILSFGPLQWNFGQNTLEPVLIKIYKKDPSGFRSIMGDSITKVIEKDIGVAGDSITESFVKINVLSSNGSIKSDWKKRFSNLAKTKAAKDGFIEATSQYYINAMKLASSLGLDSERGYALCFDIAVQNGAPRQDHIHLYNSRIHNLSQPKEIDKLKLLATAVADLANPRWRGDVLSRKMSIATGQGVVHGSQINLARDFDIKISRTWFEQE